MSWLKNNNFSFNRQPSRPLDPKTEYNASACYQSFCKHWQQAHDIIVKSQPHQASIHEDVLGVVSHLEHLATLLLFELEGREALNAGTVNITPGPSPATCLEYLLSENLLDKLYEWSANTGRYQNVVRLEQLKIYSLLVTHYGSQLLAAEPFLRPQLKLLASCRNDLLATDVETRLISLLGQLCVVLMQNMRYVDLFFISAPGPQTSQPDFIIVSLLLSCVHREGSVGGRARDALLLCACMSARSDALAHYMLHDSNVCPVLATGLSGLYSLLPRTLGPCPGGWHRLTPDDVNSVHKLALFINSLEFCNAVAQVAHPSIKRHLLDFLYQGFLVPVMGPALLQTRGGALQSGAAEQVGAAAYLELSLRSVTARGLLRTLLRFLMQCTYDGVRVLDVMWQRLEADSQLTLVTLALMETLIELNCEDVMLELVFKYLLDSHQQPRARPDAEAFRDAADVLLGLVPSCCMRVAERASVAVATRMVAAEGGNRGGRRSLGSAGEQSIVMDMLVPETKISYGLNSNESLYGNYHSYLCDARRKLKACALACSQWSCQYDGTSAPNLLDIVNDFRHEHANLFRSGDPVPNGYSSGKDLDSLPSIGESSGYESFKYSRTDGESPVEEGYCEDEMSEFAEESFWKVSTTSKNVGSEMELDRLVLGGGKRPNEELNIGPLLKTLLNKVSTMLSADLYVNLRVTGLVTRLAVFPSPVLATLLLCPGGLQPGAINLFQILSNLKQEIEAVTSTAEPGLVRSLVEEARIYLVRRELALANARRDALVHANTVSVQNATTSFSSGHVGHSTPRASPTAHTQDSPFRRSEPKRRSLSSSFTAMFRSKLAGASPSTPTPASPHTPPPTSRSSPAFDHDSPTQRDTYWQSSTLHRATLLAVLLDEWLQELSAVAREHSLRRATIDPPPQQTISL